MRKILLSLAVSTMVILSSFSQQPIPVRASTVSAEAAKLRFDGASWWNYVKVLASDDMEGRETGSASLRRAEAYIVEQLQADGLEPAGASGFYQPIKFESRQVVESGSSLALVNGRQVEPLSFSDDAFFSTRVDLAPSVEAPLVFAGYGLSVPEKNYDDLVGLDLKGKVAVIISGAPADIPGALASHYQSAAERWKALRKAGAVGTVVILNPAAMDIPWERISVNRTHPSMSLSGAEFDETAGEKLAVIFNPSRAGKLFEGSGHKLQEILDLAKARKSLPRFPLALSIRAKAEVNRKALESSNVIAKFPGTDPRLLNEYVVLSAHIDHIGVGEPINGDRIYNGAMDNAAGSAVLLDVAASLRKATDKPRRSVLFVFLTGEEKGLLGSRYFTAYPTVKPSSMIADINIDMFLPIVPLKVLTIYGLAESSLGDLAKETAQSLGVRSQPDPEPQRNAFIRSDQYNFIRKGIPALAMGVGFDPGSPQQQVFKDWLTHRYHAPSDDLNQPVDLGAAAKYEDMIRTLMLRVADSPQRPEWNPDSFFRRYAGMGAGSL
ncbi:MAG TPA: M28 family metallopeptidase [Candidatus Angelobacter sp.]|nr:M28 family metallopeptidase [Candidatus Angelobacter sp.]